MKKYWFPILIVFLIGFLLPEFRQNVNLGATSVLNYWQGGTGTSTKGASGDVLYWNGTNWQGIATSSLNITGSGSSFSYLFPSNATTTSLAFNGGLTFTQATGTSVYASASSTIQTLNSTNLILTNALGRAYGGTATTTWITGSIVFSDSTKFTEDNTNLFWDDTNNRLGIGGTTTPQRALSVAGPIVSAECNLTDGATVTFNLASCNQGRVVLGGNRALDFTNVEQALGQVVRVIVCQDGTGSRTLTHDTLVRWAGGTAPTLTTTANKCDVLAGFTSAASGTPIIMLDKVLSF